MLSPIEELLDDVRAGRPVILVDDADRENEGDLIVAADRVTPEVINFMATHGRGLICMPMTPERLDALQLPPMTDQNTSHFGTAFHVSFGARHGVTTGISAHDRARTVQQAIAPDCRPEDLTRPGHVFPLRAREGGVLVRAGHTEAAVDLARLAGLQPAAVICEVMDDDGEMARLPRLGTLAQEHGLKIGTIQSLIAYRRQFDKLVARGAETLLPTDYGDFRLVAFENALDHREHLALVAGDIGDGEDVLVRVHSECLTGDAFHSLRCDCGKQLDHALRTVAEAGRGIVLYMRQEGRGIGLMNKIRAYQLQDEGLDTVEANVHLGFDPDPREYGLGAQMLSDLGVRSMRLITNNPVKRAGLEGYGLRILGRVPSLVVPNPHNQRYLETKARKMGHLIDMPEDSANGHDRADDPSAPAGVKNYAERH